MYIKYNFSRVEQSGVSEPNILTGGNTRISPEGHVTWHIYTTLHVGQHYGQKRSELLLIILRFQSIQI